MLKKPLVMMMEQVNVNPEAFRRAVYVLKEGGIVAYPTEGVYGLGCDPSNEAAIQSLITLKQRDKDQGLLLIAASLEQLAPYMQPLSEEHIEKMIQTQAVTTWLVPAAQSVSPLLTGKHKTLGVRITQNPQAKELCLRFGKAIVSTSANITGQEPAMDNLQVYSIFKDKINYILPGRVGSLGKASTLRDLFTDEILRE